MGKSFSEGYAVGVAIQRADSNVVAVRDEIATVRERESLTRRRVELVEQAIETERLGRTADPGEAYVNGVKLADSLREFRGRIDGMNRALNDLKASPAFAPAEELLASVRGVTSDLASQISRMERRLATVEAVTAIDAKGILTEGDGTAGETLEERVARNLTPTRMGKSRKARGK